MDAIANEAFWTSNTESDVTRILYAFGEIDLLYPKDDPTYDRDLGIEVSVLAVKIYDKNGEKRPYTAVLGKQYWASNMAQYLNRSKKEESSAVPVWLFSNE